MVVSLSLDVRWPPLPSLPRRHDVGRATSRELIASERVGDPDVADAYRTGLTIHAESIDVDVTLRGTAEALLLWLWERIDIAGGELDIDGDRWSFTPTPGASPGVPGRAPRRVCVW
jgi:hypothetical protein